MCFEINDHLYPYLLEQNNIYFWNCKSLETNFFADLLISTQETNVGFV